MTRWKVILAAIIIFVAGAATGGAIIHSLPRPQPKKVNNQPFNGDHRRSYLQRLDKEVHLTPDQREKVEKILADGQERMKKLWEPIAPKARDEYRRTRQEISEILTPEQREKMKNLRSRWERNKDNERERKERGGKGEATSSEVKTNI